MSKLDSPPRSHGLDSLRATAIVMVLVYHYQAFVSQGNLFGFMSQLGWVGVDLFFVLSGYLIGNQILSAAANKHAFSFKAFYIRRALRTLPNYYVVLALYFLFPVALSGSATAPFWEFLTFTQNLNMRPGQTFTHSWSLCIEEQFYLVLPLVVFTAAKLKQPAKILWAIIVCAMVFAATLRGIHWYQFGGQMITAADYWQHIYYSSFTRFDELLPGVAIALLKNFHNTTYGKILGKGREIFLAGIIATTGTFYLLDNYFYVDGYGFTLWMAISGYSILSISFALLVLAALSPRSMLYRVKIPGATNVALWSYAIYLIHRPIFKILPAQLTGWGIDVNSLIGMSVIMVLSGIAGWLLYRCVEMPFMSLRDSYFPSNRKMPSRQEEGALSSLPIEKENSW